MAKLLISLPTGDVPHELEGEVITIGRTSDNSIQIDHTSVSAHHAKLFLINGIYKLKDLDSTNRSCINGIPVSEAELISSCFLRFGNIECVYKAEGSNASDQMQTVMGDLQKQLQDLQKQQEEVGQHSRVLIKERDEAKGQAVNFSERLDEKQKQIETFTLERAVLLQANKDLKTKLDILSTELGELKKKAERLPALQDAERQAQELAAKLTETQRQADTMMRERVALLHSSKEMSTRMDALTAQLNDNQHKAEQFPAYTAATQQKIDELTREREALLRENNELKAMLEATALQAQQPVEPTVETPPAVLPAVTFRVQQDMDSPEEEEYEDEREPETPAEVARPKVSANTPRQAVTMAAEVAATAPLLSSWLKRAAKSKTPAIREDDSQETQQMVLNETLSVALPSAVPIAPKVANGTALKARGAADDTVHQPAEVKQALDLLNGMRRTLHYFLRNQKDLKILQELSRNANDLLGMTQIVALHSTGHLALSLKTLLDDLNTNAQNINPSSLRTVGQSIDFFATLLDEKNLSKIHDVSGAKIFALDDDEGILETIAATMDMVKLKVTTCADPLASLEKLSEEGYDMILLDVGLPQMNGLDVCARVRSLPQHRNTPIVFLTGAATVQNRVQSTLSGGNDLIGKPFSVHELAVKVLTWIYKGQMGLT